MKQFRIPAIATLCLFACAAALSARAAPPPLAAYGKLPLVEQMALSPSGDRYAMIRVTDNARQLIIVPVAGGTPTVLSFAGKDKLRDLSWAGDDHVIVTATATLHDGAEFTTDAFEIAEALVYPLNKHPSFVVFSGERRLKNLVAGEYGYAQVGGHWYGYFGALNQGFGEELYRVDLDTGEKTQVKIANGQVGGFLIGPDGSVVARSYYFAKTGAWQVNAGGSGGVILSGRSLMGGPGLAGLGKAPGTLLVHNPDRGVADYQVASLAGEVPVPVPDGDRIAETLFDRQTGLWIGEVLEGDTPQTVLFAPERQARMNGARKAFANYNVQLRSWDADFNHLIIFTDGGDDSGTYWLVDIAKHSVESIGQAYPDVKEADVGPVSMVDWKAADGLEEHGVLTLPPGRPAHNLPVVVLPHGGPQAQDRAGFDWWAQAFASRGYAVFQPNFRGSDGYGQSFVDAGHGQWGRKMQTDVSDGLMALAKRGVVDPKRACIVGGSYGGYAALAGVTVQQGVYRCAVADAPVSDLRQMLKYEDANSGYDAYSVSMRYWKQFMGPDSGSDGGLDAISPAKLAGKADAPILLVHGKDDSVVPFEQSNEMLAALKRAGKPVEMVVMPNEDHWLSRTETRLSMLTAAVAFVQKYNPAD
jgi:dipeptidyl aminopeptidase/acylaminoacyl peptidase